MNRTPVNSSILTSVGYNPEKKTLEIEFQSGGIYRYHNIPESIYSGLMKAESYYSYFERYIKVADYAYKRIK